MQKRWATLWKEAATRTRGHYRDCLRREARWRLLANASPQKENALALEKKIHECETLHDVLRGVYSDLQAIMDEDFVSIPVRKKLRHIIERWRN